MWDAKRAHRGRETRSTQPEKVEFSKLSPYPGDTGKRPRHIGGAFRHEWLVETVQSGEKLRRMKANGCSDWLLRQERLANSRGYTLMRHRPTSQWVLIPLERATDRVERLLDERSRERAILDTKGGNERW